MMALQVEDFSEFFAAIHGHPPFPWQVRLASRVVADGAWPPLLDLPTGSGKTAAIDIAVFHLAMEADRGEERRAAVRVAFVVDRRLVVDDAHARAERIATALEEAPPRSVLALVAERLRLLSGEGPPLLTRSLRGGMPLEDDWVRSPSQPVVLCSTVDQIGSRLLFRGYGVSDRMKPVHAGLVGSDCLILLDEAHLAEPFRQTLAQVSMYRSDAWRDTARSHAARFATATLTATPGAAQTMTAPAFGLNTDDREHDLLRRRLRAPKVARLLLTASPRAAVDDLNESESEGEPTGLEAFVDEVRAALASFVERGDPHPAIGVVVNRIGRARGLFERLRLALPNLRDDITLMIGPVRPVDRDHLVRALEPIRTTAAPERSRMLERAVVLVATQCIEAGVDIDLDALITEAAPIDALRQRFGRLNRAGRDIEPYAAVVGLKSVLRPRTDDPVYGTAVRVAWDYLTSHAKAAGKQATPTLDFGIEAFDALVAGAPPPQEAYSPKAAAPVLLPAHLDLLCQTSPVPLADPDVALYLHGANREPDSVSVVWRADLYPRASDDWNEDNERLRRLLALLPPRSTEAIQLPLWAVKRWLNRQGGDAAAGLADIASANGSDSSERTATGRWGFRWLGDDERSRWIQPSEIRPGDTIVVPTYYGGLDEFGWNPSQPGELEGGPAVADRADTAAAPYAARRFVVRVVPGLIGGEVALETLLATLAEAPDHWQARRDALLDLPLPADLRHRLLALERARGRRQVVVYDDLYGEDGDRPRGVVFVARLGLLEPELAMGGLVEEQPGGQLRKRIEVDVFQTPATEDDALGSVPGFPVRLDVHTGDVVTKAGEYAERAGLPPARVRDIRIAAMLHDAGKVDERFQAWLHSSDPLGAPDLDAPDQFLAKSGRRLSWQARERLGLPPRWRHEALSVRIASLSGELAHADDPDLVLWLIGTHHGFGRPFFPHEDCHDQRERVLPAFEHVSLPGRLESGAGPQSLAFDWKGFDWATLGQLLAARYGAWELARMEAILRLADHRASEEEARRIPDEEARA